LVILDYDLPRNQHLRRWVLSFLMLFETPYLRDFSKEGVLPILKTAGYASVAVRHCPFSFFTVYEVSLPTTYYGAADPKGRQGT
jgi:hypothetical protein